MSHLRRLASIARLRRGLAGRRQHGWVQRAEYFSKLFARLAGVSMIARVFIGVRATFHAVFHLFAACPAAVYCFPCRGFPSVSGRLTV
jgi:hypothetical protein